LKYLDPETYRALENDAYQVLGLINQLAGCVARHARRR
jgi:hypothetical protein